MRSFWFMPGRHTEQEWAALLHAWRWRCFYCGNPIRLRWEDSALTPENEATKDHLVPICRGGDDFIENIVPACKRCNCMKGQKTAAEFLASRPLFRVQNENFPTGNAFVPSPEGCSQEEKDEPGLLRKLQAERECVSWAWRNPAPEWPVHPLSEKEKSA